MSPMDPARYLDLFVSESRDHVAAAAGLASRLGTDPGGGPALGDLFRHLHSLKGMAATMGFPAMQDLAHAAEGLLESVREGRVPADGTGRSLIAASAACLERMVERADRGDPVDDPQAASLRSALRAAAWPASDPPGDDPHRAAPVPAAEGAGPRTWRVALIIDREKPFPALRAATVVGRLGRLGRVDAIEPPMALLRMGKCDGRLAVVVTSGLDADTLSKEIARLEDVATFTLVPVAPVEDAGRRTPVRWARVRADLLDRLSEDAEELARLQGDPAQERRARSLAHRLQRDLAEASLVPFERAALRLGRGASDLALSLGKDVRVEIEGRDVRLDRSLLDALVDPLLHLMRNAVDHGLESPDERRAAGKPASGRLRLAAVRQAGSIHIEVDDDGRGFDHAALRHAAEERGLLPPGAAARLTDDEALTLATLPGLSAARSQNEISGRGVGLDVVAASVAQMGGRLTIGKGQKTGTTIRLDFPLTRARVPSLLLRCGGELYAIPAATVRRAAPPGPAIAAGARDLAEILAVPPAAPGARRAALELATASATTIVVDEVVGRREIELKPVSPWLLAAKIYSGAAVLDDGTIVPMLAPEALS